MSKQQKGVSHKEKVEEPLWKRVKELIEEGKGISIQPDDGGANVLVKVFDPELGNLAEVSCPTKNLGNLEGFLGWLRGLL
jgi:hypothetical protein